MIESPIFQRDRPKSSGKVEHVAHSYEVRYGRKVTLARSAIHVSHPHAHDIARQVDGPREALEKNPPHLSTHFPLFHALPRSRPGRTQLLPTASQLLFGG